MGEKVSGAESGRYETSRGVAYEAVSRLPFLQACHLCEGSVVFSWSGVDAIAAGGAPFEGDMGERCGRCYFWL